ncbi:MAG: ARPP-1 family domain-containing protein [Promethearchaeota archaeon]
MTESKEAVDELLEAIDELELGETEQIGHAHFIPILDKDPERERSYITVNEALKAGVLELRDSGSIDTLIAVNRGDMPILFIAGMNVHAEGTQSRVVVGSHLVPAKSKTEIPCRCTHDVHPISAGHGIMTDVAHYGVASPKVRAHTLGRATADQSAVWDKVRRHREEMKSKHYRGRPVIAAGESSTRHSDVQARAIARMREELSKLKPQDRQVGLAVISEGKLMSLEVFDSVETYRELHDKLIARFASEIAAEKATPKTTLTKLRKEMLKQLRSLSIQLQVDGSAATYHSEKQAMNALWDKRRKPVHYCLSHF